MATAFKGESPTKEHVVDHIDTNKQNNRPENLCWATRFENVLLNPISARRIEIVCGSVEEFLADPSRFRALFPEPNYQWMCTVSKEEAQISLKRLTEWAHSDKSFSGGTLGLWIYSRGNAYNEQKVEEVFKQVEEKTGISRMALCSNKAKRNEYYQARIYAAKLLRKELDLSDYAIGKLMNLAANTVNLYLEVCADWFSGDHAKVSEKQYRLLSEQSEIIPGHVIQKNWGAQSEFPCCPPEPGEEPISAYAGILGKNAIFFENPYYYTTVVKKAIIDDRQSLLVLYAITKKETSNERWGIMKVVFEEGTYVHEIILNYNGTLEHYWLIDAENHFNAIVSGENWMPLYDASGREFKDDYMPM